MTLPATFNGFTLIDATIADIHAAYAAGTLTCRALVEAYLDRIETIDRAGPKINSIISVNPQALEQADALDAAHAEAAHGRGGLAGHAEQARQPVGRQRHHETVEPAPALVACEHLRIAEI